MCYSARGRGITKLESALIIALIVASILGGYAWIAKPSAPTQAPTPAPALRTITIVDSAGRYVEVPWPVKRVAALTGDAAMALVALGAKDSIVGISMYAIDEPWAPKNIQSIGSCFKPDIEAIIATKPEVVITYVRWPGPEALEEKLEPLGIKVIRLDFYKLDTLFSEFRVLGLLLNRTERANELVEYWKGVLERIEERVKKVEPGRRLRVYFESYTDYTAAGPGTGWDEILRRAGGINVFAESPIPYPKVSPEAVIEKNPDVILKAVPSTRFKAYGATDPTPLGEIYDSILARPGWAEIKAVKEKRVYIICSHYLHDLFGLIAETAYVAKILYPDLFRDMDPTVHLRYFLENNLGIEYSSTWIYPPLE